MTVQSKLRIAFRALMTGLFFVAILYAYTAQADDSFSSSYLQGTYAYTNTTDGIGGAGLITFDGNGQVTMAIRVNVPGKNGGREIVTLSGAGNYSVGAAGTGLATIKAKSAKGKELKLEYDFVITKIADTLAIEAFSILRSGGVQGQLVAPTWRRIR